MMKTTNKMKSFFALNVVLCSAVIALLASQVWAQQIPQSPPPRHPAKDLPMPAGLYDLDFAVRVERADAASIIRERGFIARADGTINVEIINQKGPEHVDPALITRFGGEVDATWHNRVSAWIPPDQLIAIARGLPAGFYMEDVCAGGLDDEGPGVIGSDAYRDAGADGSGIKIAVIDSGFDSLLQAQNAGAAPLTFGDTVDFAGGGIISGGRHGCGCLEMVYDHAPGATYYLYRVNGGNITHLGNAVDSAIAKNVNIITLSQSYYNKGWDDNSGGACDAAAAATAAGMLFFTSAGNRAKDHWQGDLSPTVTGWHKWAASGDVTIDIVIDSGATDNFRLSWDTTGGVYDYNLYLYNSALDSVLASDIEVGNIFEEFSWTNNIGDDLTVMLMVWRARGEITEMEVFESKSGVWQEEHRVSEGSTTSPSNSTEPNCISVGAVDWNNFTSLPGTNDINMSYSSQGPSNGGATRPKLCGPTNCSAVSYPDGGFGGTSAATPNAAGAAAAFWSSAPLLSASSVRYLLFEKAEIFKDWGSGGNDNIYGRGGVALHTYHANTIWVDRRYGNTFGFADQPFYYVSDAESWATAGGRIVFLGQSYPEVITLEKELLYETIGWPALLGD